MWSKVLTDEIIEETEHYIRISEVPQLQLLGRSINIFSLVLRFILRSVCYLEVAKRSFDLLKTVVNQTIILLLK